MSYAQNKTSYGGALLRTRKGRSGPRPLSSTQSMHVVLRASAEAGAEPFPRGSVTDLVRAILQRFAARNSVAITGIAVNHNHVHLHARFPSTKAYRRFIRAITGAIALAVARAKRWKKFPKRFWQYRPFTRVVAGDRDERIVRNYVRVNEWEAHGYPRHFARFMAAMWGRGPEPGE